MKLRVVRTTRALGLPCWVCVAAGLWLCLAAAATWLSARAPADAPLCPTRLAAGVPCPFCGTGRAGLHALRGRLLHAWRLNPLMATAAAAGAAMLLCRIALARRLAIELTARERRAAWAAAAALLAANWLYVAACVG